MQISGANILPPHYISVWKWVDMEEGSPDQMTRNRWLWEFGAFGKYRHPITGEAIWFPAQVIAWNIAEKPTTVASIRISGNDLYTSTVEQMLPPFMPVEDLEAFYYFLPLGMSMRIYLAEYLPIISDAKSIISQGVRRSLDTAILLAPRRWGRHFKKALNFLQKGEWYVVEGNQMELEASKVLEIPTTADKLTYLWDSYDWAKQDMLVKIGFSYNPEKRERMIQAEMIAQSQIIRAYRDLMIDTLQKCTLDNNNGERVYHIVDFILKTETHLQSTSLALSVGANDEIANEIFAQANDGNVYEEDRNINPYAGSDRQNEVASREVTTPNRETESERME